MITKRMVGQPWFDQLNKFIIHFTITYHRVCNYRVAQRVRLVGQELFTLPEHLSSPPIFGRVRVARSLVFCVMFCIYIYYMYIGQQYATQHIPKFYASFILLNVFPQRKKMYSYLFLGDLGLLSMPHDFNVKLV
jgi:hypothetical protein